MEGRGLAERFCIVGAGSSGLAVAKNFQQAGVAFDCLEREEVLGGNWAFGRPASSVCRSTHLISSKALTEYSDFPMPEEYPEFPNHELAWKYLRDYADHFGLDRHIQYCTGVRRCTPLPEGGWNVELDRGEVRHYSGLVIANGHNWDPRFPEYPGTFDGLALHSAEYKTPDVLRGKRVLIVGAGNSGCDLAVESATNAAATFHSLRRGYHYLPKFFGGFPIDAVGEMMLRWKVPLPLRRLLARRAIRLVNGVPEQLGLPAPDHRLFETHPIINSQFAYHLGHGDICVKPDVAEFCGDQVRFVDGSSETIDVLLFATGYKISFPFIRREELHWQGDRPELYLNLFHPHRDDLFVVGLIQPDSGQWGIVDCQAQLLTAYVQGLRAGKSSAARFQKKKAREGTKWNRKIHYMKSPRHLLEVEHFSYRKTLERWTRKLQ